MPLSLLMLAVGTAAALGWHALRPAKPVAVLSGMAWLPGGTFLMGSTPEEIAAECQRLGAACQRERIEREQPAHQVTLSPFYLDLHEVTNRDYAHWLELSARLSLLDIRKDDDSHLPRFIWHRSKQVLLIDLYEGQSGIQYVGDSRFTPRAEAAERPVDMVTWDGAALYCQAKGKRLPTEAEWELAARGLKRRRWPWGDEPPRCEGVVFARHDGASCAPLPHRSAPVGSAPMDQTPEGITDLAGNVMEWVQDPFRLPYYPPCGACKDPKGEAPLSESPSSPAPTPPLDDDARILRGGSWENGEQESRAAGRGRRARSEILISIGFRCAAQG